jgi:ATP/maltotriose-dependent transcriptional regulator MalT
LTRRERDVLTALCRPLLGDDVIAQPASVKEIAAELVVTDAAVKQHLLHLYDKLGIEESGERRRVALASRALQLGLVEAPAGLADTRSIDAIADGREAFARHEWERAATLLADADAPDDLLVLGEALLWSNQHERSFRVKERAYQAYLRAGDKRSAGFVAVLLAVHNAVRLDMAVASGWLAKAQNLLDGEPDCREYGYLSLVRALLKERAGDWEGVLELAENMRDLGRHHGDADLEALGLVFEGLVATRRGSLAEGQRLLDEAMASAIGGELGVFATGVVYCRMMVACVALHDYRRAGEWTEVVERCSHTTGHLGFPGDCRTHHTALLVKRGAWAECEREALLAIEETDTFDLPHKGAVACSLGDLFLRRGDLDVAESWFVHAHEIGVDPRPGLSLVQLARGDVAAAAASLDDALEGEGLDPLTRVPFLAARVEVNYVRGDIEGLRAVAAELEETSRTYGTNALAAHAAYARGAAEVAGGNPAEASQSLKQAHQLWLEGEVPYEAARARELLAESLHQSGKVDASTLELRAARAAFTQLGADLDVERVDRRLAAPV